jgi:hydroxymethylpyrimidine kinase/phosphomethylpyrimidine kinase
MIPNVLSIAGSDPSGGAGLQADLKTFGALGCYGMAVITALTAQNTQSVAAVHVPPADFVAQQIAMIFADIDVAAIKIGLLPNAEIVKSVANELARQKPCPIVLDPVLVATSGDPLSAGDVPAALVKYLFPLATLVTPNISEGARLADCPLPQDLAGVRLLAPSLLQEGARAVLLKGGHLEGEMADDLLFEAAGETLFSAPRVKISNTHGTGCTLSAAIAAHLAKGLDLVEAITAAKAFLTSALKAADELNVGRGAKPLHHFFGTRD